MRFGLALEVIVMTILIPSLASAELRFIDLAIRERVLPPEQRLIRVQQGEEVTLRWTTNHEITVHLHGYDIEKRLKPGETTTMTFRARAAGRFPITVHGAHAGSGGGSGQKGQESILGYFEVHPR